MDFYVLLASNNTDFAANTPGEYTVHLPRNIMFDDHWQVALTEISFVRSWQTISNVHDSAIVINCGARARGIRVRPEQYLSPEHLVYEINASIQQGRGLPSGTINSLTTKYDDFAQWAKEMLRRREDDDQISPIDQLKFSFDGRKVIVEHPKSIKSIWCSPAIRALLGFGNRQWFEQQSEEANSVPDMTGGISMLYVYSNVARSRIVSNIMAPLLRVVTVPHQLQFGHRASVTFDHPEYLPVDGEGHDLIHIKIRNALGEIVNFNTGEVVATLHFRPVPRQLLL